MRKGREFGGAYVHVVVYSFVVALEHLHSGQSLQGGVGSAAMELRLSGGDVHNYGQVLWTGVPTKAGAFCAAHVLQGSVSMGGE